MGSNPARKAIACRKGVVNASDHSPQMGDKTDAEIAPEQTIMVLAVSLYG